MKKKKQTSLQQIFEFYNSKKEPNINDFTDNETPLFDDYNGRLLIYDNNFNALKNLLNKGYTGRVDLIYIDPPFGIGKRFENKKSGMFFDDKTVGSEYLQFMYERLILLRELLSDEGSIYLHCDWHKSHHLRFLLDEVFGEENFVNEVVWENQGSWIEPDNKFPNRHNNLYIYSKYKDKIFNRLYEADFSKSVNYQRWNDYIIDDKIYGANYPKSDSRFNSYLNKFIENYKREPIENDIIVDFKGEVLGSIWYEKTVDPKSAENINYPTQKSEALLERIVKASSNEGSIVLDCFMGSGTTQAVAQKLGRKWIGIDCNKDSVETVKKRFLKKFNMII